MLTNVPAPEYSNGCELIEAVKAHREEAETFRALAKDVENELAGDLDRYDPELIDGVRLRWISEGVAARDETAFRHALKVGHRLRARGERLTDAAMIDAYEHAYEVAQIHGGASRVRTGYAGSFDDGSACAWLCHHPILA